MMVINLLGLGPRPFSSAPAAHLMPTRNELTPMALLIGFIITGLVLITKKITQ